MKIAEAPVNRTTNSRGKKFSGRLNTDKLGSFMQTLIRNYNNPDLATLREWVSNAHDSHVQAGQTRPIRVTLPTRLAPALTVEDWGIGMSYEDVENVYAVMLTSTKDLDNDGIGGFGIGGKSALAIADQYTMVTIKDGLKNIFIFERSDEGGLEITNALENEPTEEPNGVKVTVAVSDSRQFHDDNLSLVLGGWRPSEIELIGGSFRSIYEGTIEFGDGFVESNSFDSTKEPADNNNYYRGSHSRVYIMVGPVLYGVTNRAHHGFSKKFTNLNYALNGRVVLKLPIGSVTVPSSREVIEDTDANAEVIVAAANALADQIQAHVDTLVAELSTIEEAYAFATSKFAKSSNLQVKFEGRDLTKVVYPYKFKISGNVSHNRTYDHTLNQYVETSNFKLMQDIPFAGHGNTPPAKLETPAAEVDIVVLLEKENNDFSIDTYRKYLRSHVEAWIETNKPKSHYRSGATILLTEKHDPLMEITSTVWKYAELRKTAVVPKKGSYAKLSDQQRLARAKDLVTFKYTAGGLETQSTVGSLELNPKKKQVVLIHSSGVTQYVIAFRALFGLTDELVVLSNKKSFESFKKVYTNAILVDEFLQSVSPKKKLAAHKLMNSARKLGESLVLDSSALVKIDDLHKANLLDSTTQELLYSPEARLVAALGSLWARPTSNVSSVNYDAFMAFVDKDQHPLRSYRKVSGPFSLATWRGEADDRELADYLNWSATRQLSAPQV